MDTDPASANRRPIQPVLIEPEHVFGTLGNLAIAVTRDPPTSESVRQFIHRVDKLRKEHPDGVVVVVAPRAKRPALSAEARQTIVAHWPRIERHMSCCVVLFRASGFVSAIQRSLVTTIMSLRRTELPIKVSSNPFDAATFIVRHDANFKTAQTLGSTLQAFVKEHEDVVR